MKIINIGGATAILEHKGKRILFDPWMDDGIFHGAWYHYPPSNVSIEEIGHLDYVYISHIHEDHCSAGTIKYLNQDAEVLILDKKPNFVAKFLDNHAFKFKAVNLIKHQSPVEIAPGFIVDMLEGDPSNPMSHAIDSIMIIRWDDYVIVNANDCNIYPEALDYILNEYKKVDFAFVPYGGGSGYPSCYSNLTEDEKENEKNRIINLRLENFVETVNKLKPKYVMPFADQYIVAGSRSHLNKYISHPVCSGFVAKYLQGKEISGELVLLNSGQAFELEGASKTPAQEYMNFDEKDRAEYLEKLSDKKYDYEHIHLNPAVALERLVNHARERLWKVQEKHKYFPDYKLYLEAKDQQRRFEIDFSQQSAKEISYYNACEEPYLRISVPGSLLMLLLVGHVSWNIADAALFIDYERCPNVYDGKIYEFLNYLKV